MAASVFRLRGICGSLTATGAMSSTRTATRFADHLILLVRQGVCGAVYTQTTDVEGEVNGLMTYDRKVVKMNEKKLNEINTKVIKSMPVK